MSLESRSPGPNVGRFPYMTRDNNPPPTASAGIKNGDLSVRSVDLLKSRKGQNRVEHHTDCYHNDNLIVRRGQSFQMWIELSRSFDPKSDKLHLELKLGIVPSLSKGTLVTVPLVVKLENKTWEAEIIEQKDTKINLLVNIPATGAIGRYKLSVISSTPKGSNTYSCKPENDIYLLFNPWCEDDSVFMDNEEERKEYVLNDVGTLYYGNENQISGRTWIFGQFDDEILAACLFILEKCQSLTSGWGDPVNIVRVVSAMVNSDNYEGVLEGNWSDNFSDGTSPMLWNGSVEILRQYHKSGGKPVRYGQCWVYAGVTNTILRCLGIPTRSITNFSSAHDTDVSLTSDVYFDENMMPIDSLNNDSIWNFHVWNESWMVRPDLQEGMGGWQAVDSTPQETSQGIFCCGPAPVVAIRDGLVYLKYDVPFVFAEVNSERVFWQKQPNGTFSQIYCEKNVVGHCISTKAVGSDSRVDITDLYKYPEGSEAEKITVETASRYGSKPNLFPCAVTNDVELQVTMEGEAPWVGEDAQLSITMKNGSSEQRSIVLYCQVAVMYYTGVQKGIVKKDEIKASLKPKEVQTQVWTVSYNQYKDQLVDHAALMLTVFGRVSETQQILTTRFNFRLHTPELIITSEPAGDAIVGIEMKAKITFKNPLQCTLKNVMFHIDGLGLLNTKDLLYGDIDSLATIALTVKFTPTLSGQRKLLASLDCQQLRHVHGVADILVKKK